MRQITHYDIICSECGKRIGGCRCAAPDKEKRKGGLCDECFAKKPPEAVSLEDANEALWKLARIRGVSVEEMKKIMNEIHEDALKALEELDTLSNEKIIKRVKWWQNNTMVHPLTCGKNSNHLLEPREVKGKVILACPECDYIQKHIPKIVLVAPDS